MFNSKAFEGVVEEGWPLEGNTVRRIGYFDTIQFWLKSRRFLIKSEIDALVKLCGKKKLNIADNHERLVICLNPREKDPQKRRYEVWGQRIRIQQPSIQMLTCLHGCAGCAYRPKH